jgi:hypothetical protein
MARNENIRFEIPKQTQPGAPFQQTFVLWLPVVNTIAAQVPDGHKGLTEMEVLYPGGVLMNEIKGNKQTKESGPLGIRLFGPPYLVTCRGYNLDVFLPHEFLIEINTGE